MPDIDYNPKEYTPVDEYDALPAGNYLAEIVGSEIKETVNKDGRYLLLSYKILDEKYKGRLVFSNHNIENPSQQAVDISMRELRSICDAVGHTGVVRMTEELHGKTLSLKLGVKKYQGEDKNEVKAWKPAKEKPTPTSTPQTESKPEKEEKKPWDKSQP